VKHIPFDPTEGIEPKDYEDVAYKLYDRSVNLQDLLEKSDRGVAVSGIKRASYGNREAGK
jgi:hypothetical protein